MGSPAQPIRCVGNQSNPFRTFLLIYESNFDFNLIRSLSTSPTASAVYYCNVKRHSLSFLCFPVNKILYFVQSKSTVNILTCIGLRLNIDQRLLMAGGGWLSRLVYGTTGQEIRKFSVSKCAPGR